MTAADFSAFAADARRKLEALTDATLHADGRFEAHEPLTVKKFSAFVQMSEDQLMDAGVIPDTRPPVRYSLRLRLRWGWQEWRERVGRKVGGWIAGVDLDERDDW